MNKNKTLYVSDLDLTLLNSDGFLSDFAVANLNHFIDKGLLFTVATARSLWSIQPILKGLKLRLPIIQFNGGYITDFESGKNLIINDFDDESQNYLRDIFARNNLNYFLSTNTDEKQKIYYIKIENAGEKWWVDERIRFKDPRLHQVKSIDEHLDEKTMCFTLINKEEILRPIFDDIIQSGQNIEAYFQENFYSRGWWWLTVHSHLTRKDKAIASLRKLCNLTDCKLTTFGDNTNDIKMLEYADTGIAVENACQELKEVADLHIGTNDENSVIKFIAKDNNWDLIENIG